MPHLRFDVSKLHKLNDPARLDSIRPDVLWKALESPAPNVIVEIGAGTGLFSARFAACAPEATVYAVDVEPLMVEWMTENRPEVAHGRIVPVLSAQSEVPLPDRFADAVIMVNLHHELADPSSVYGEALRMLVPGGRILVVDWALRETPGGPPQRVRVAAPTFEAMLLDAGFINVDVTEEALDQHILATGSHPGIGADIVPGDDDLALCRVRGPEGGRLISFALHAGHALRPGLADHMRVTPSERRREEDPFTALMAPTTGRTIEVLRSRFEVDLNRPRARAVYSGPDDTWGLDVWRGEPPGGEARVSRGVHDAFYRLARRELISATATHDEVLLLDLHSYNHRRLGAEVPPAEEETNPEINVGTRHIDRDRWAPVIDAFNAGLRDAGFDVRENVKFGGGHLCRWTSRNFPQSVCPLAIEFKKTFVDEWSGIPDRARIARIAQAVSAASDAAMSELGAVR